MWSRPPVPFKAPGLESSTPSEGSLEKDINFLRKGRKHNRTRNGHSLKVKTRGNIKFRPLDDDDSTDSDMEAGHVSKGDVRRISPHPRLPGVGTAATTYSITSTVLEEGVHSHVDNGKELYQAAAPTRLPAGLEGSDMPDYSDHEVDIALDAKSVGHDPDWTPRFLQDKVQPPRTRPANPPTTQPLDQALSGTGRRGPPQKVPRDSPGRQDSPRWQAFWRDVNEKIQHRQSL
jgi:hypothetical protein